MFCSCFVAHKFNPVFLSTVVCSIHNLCITRTDWQLFFYFLWVAPFLQQYTWYLILELDLTWRMPRCRIDGSVKLFLNTLSVWDGWVEYTASWWDLLSLYSNYKATVVMNKAQRSNSWHLHFMMFLPFSCLLYYSSISLTLKAWVWSIGALHVRSGFIWWRPVPPCSQWFESISE